MLVRLAQLFATALGLFLSSLTAAAQSTTLPGQTSVPPAPSVSQSPPAPQPPPTLPWWLPQPGVNWYDQKGYGRDPYAKPSYGSRPYWSGTYGGGHQAPSYPSSYMAPGTAAGQQPSSPLSHSHDSGAHHKEGAAATVRPQPVYPSVSDTDSPYHYFAPGQDYYSPTSSLRTDSYSAKPYGGKSGSYSGMPYGMMGYGYAPYGGGYGAYGSNYGSNYGSKSAAYNSTDSSSSKPTYPPTSAPVVDVGLYDNHFRPGVTYVSAGTVVRFTNRGRHHHTVTSDEGLWDSGELRPGGEGYSVFFPMPGTFYYHCKMHRGMKGSVIVRGAYD